MKNRKELNFVAKVLQRIVGVNAKSIEPFKQSWVISEKTTNGNPKHIQLIQNDNSILYYGTLKLKMFVDGAALNDPLLNTAVEMPFKDSPAGSILGGRLYNGKACRLIAPVGWELPSQGHFTALSTAMGSDLGQKMKTANGWANNSGLDSIGMSVRPSGKRTKSGQYSNGTTDQYWKCIQTDGGVNIQGLGDTVSMYNLANGELAAWGLRFKKITTTLNIGDTSTVTGYDGKVYPTVCIGSGGTKYEFMAVNSMETMLPDGSLIKNITVDTEYDTQCGSIPIWCDYANNAANSGTYVNKPIVSYQDFDLTFNNGSWAVVNVNNHKNEFGNRLARKIVEALTEFETEIEYSLSCAMRLTYCVNPSNVDLYTKIIIDFTGYRIALY